MSFWLFKFNKNPLSIYSQVCGGIGQELVQRSCEHSAADSAHKSDVGKECKSQAAPRETVGRRRWGGKLSIQWGTSRRWQLLPLRSSLGDPLVQYQLEKAASISSGKIKRLMKSPFQMKNYLFIKCFLKPSTLSRLLRPLH